MWQLHHRMPAWKLKACTEVLQVRPIDLAAVAESTGIQFATDELIEVAAKCLDEFSKEVVKDDSNASGDGAASSCRADTQNEKDKPDSPNSKEESKTAEKSADNEDPCTKSTDVFSKAQNPHPLAQAMLSNTKMPQHHVIIQSLRRIVVLPRILLRIGSLVL